MTGRELILYILENKLEDSKVLEGAFFKGFMTEEEAAAKFNVGTATIRTWYNFDVLPGIKVGESLYFLKNVSDPRVCKNITHPKRCAICSFVIK